MLFPTGTNLSKYEISQNSLFSDIKKLKNEIYISDTVLINENKQHNINQYIRKNSEQSEAIIQNY